MTDLSKVKHRDALKPRREPYWHKVSQSNHLGFRKLNKDSQGTWLARTYDNQTMKKPQKRLGGFSEFPENLRFEIAQKAAQEWFTHIGRGGSTEEVTIQNVCDNYVEHLKQKGKEKGSIDASKRFKAYVLDDPRFANTPLSKLTPKLVQAWRNRLSNEPTKAGKNKGEKRTDSSLNRDMTPNSPLSVFLLLPLRALPPGLVTGAFLSCPRCSDISASRARSTSSLVNCFKSPFSPIKSSGFL